MRNFTYILLFFAFYSGASFAQESSTDKIIAFHPSAGKTIDLQEKIKYSIFKEYSDSIFQSAQLVKRNTGDYFILISTRSGKSFEKPVTIAELDAIHAAIDKVTPAQHKTVTSIEPETDRNAEEERRIRQRRTENAIIIGDIAYRSFVVLINVLVIIAQIAY
ncbi:MAG: hypothetical protein H0X46_07125 [Bacteroidetes bacterium]|nr:hypothetical protein [Bacteroidota bacterium]